MAFVSPGVPLRALLIGTNTNGVISGVTTGGAHGPVDCSGYPNLTLYIVASAALSDGTITIYERDQASDPLGVLGTIDLATAFASAGGSYAYHFGGPGGSFAYGVISAEITETVVGGTVRAVLRGC